MNDHIAIYRAPATNRLAAVRVLRAAGWRLKEGWALVTTMRDLAAKSPGIFDGVVGEAEVLDTSGNGTPVKGSVIVAALKAPQGS
jgi:hypothetical protein